MSRAPKKPEKDALKKGETDPASPKPPASLRPKLGEVDEAAVNAPTRQSLLMLSVICAATLVMWAAGRAACNYHEPGEGLTPRAVPLSELTRTPKGLAIELAQALSGGDFKVAETLVDGPGREMVKAAAKACGDCLEEKASRDKILSVAVVLRENRQDSVVRVVTTRGPKGPVKRTFRIQREPKARASWRAVAVLKEGEPLPTLTAPAETLTPPPSVARPSEEPEGSNVAAATGSSVAVPAVATP